MLALIDINIFEDIARQRTHWPASYAVLKHFRDHHNEGFVSAWTVTVIYYFRRKKLEDQQARQQAQRAIQGLTVLDFTAEVVNLAMAEQRIPDFEDAIQYHIARQNSLDVIVTRNVKDFQGVQNEITVLTPETFLQRWQKQ